MKIRNNARLRDIQAAFIEVFPYLRIEFYEDGHGPGEGSPRGKQLDPDLTLAELNSSVMEGLLEFNPDLQINEFESMMREQFELNVQVFRKSGNLWLQTITTDKWTLAQADGKGGRSSQLYRQQYDED